MVPTFWTRGRTVAVAAAVVVTVGLGLLAAAFSANLSHCSEGPVEVPCPTAPVGPDGQPVSDTFSFVHRSLGENGSITVRLVSMTGIITYPPPDHDEIVSGLVPWAKAGIIVKASLAQGSPYAALMVTGRHGVRMQYDYTHEVAGSASSGSRWLRLVRSGDVITGYESPDGERWTRVGVARLPGLPTTVRVGLFTTSPGDLTIRRTGLGAGLPESRFTQASGTFDHVTVSGSPASPWRAEAVGELGRTDWERYHRAPGLVRNGGTYTVTGSGDIAPATAEGRAAEGTLVGLVVGLAVLVVVGARFGVRAPLLGAVPTFVAGFGAGLVGAGVVLPLGTALLRAGGAVVYVLPLATEVRVIIGVALLAGLASAFAFALGALLRRAWLAVVVAISTLVVPYVLAAVPLLPDAVADWLLRLTPAAAFAVQQTVREHPYVLSHYAPSMGYFPLPWWVGLLVLAVYTGITIALAMRRR